MGLRLGLSTSLLPPVFITRQVGAFILTTVQTTKNRPRNARPVFQNLIFDPEA
jgi:hypothetical protein